MKILYLDTSSNYLYLSLINNDQVFLELREKLDQDLSEKTLVILKESLNKAHWELNDLDKIYLVNGPGSFTGTRIGVTIAKTIAWAFKKGVTVLSSLEAMSLSNSYKGFKIPLIDARRGYVYAAIYDENDEIVLKEQYIKLDILKIAVEKLGNNYLYIHDGFFKLEKESIYKPEFLKIIEKLKDRESLHPHALDVNYLKLSEAEEKKLQEE